MYLPLDLVLGIEVENSAATRLVYLGIDHFEDIGPCVIMASPGMMQSGLSRELFESWCTDPKNGVIIAGYCVEGTLAKTILSEPEEITTMSGQKLPLRMSVDYISFSAHTDYQQTSEFINILKPPHVVLVHGEQNEMSRLRAALQREHRGKLQIHTPRNTQQLNLTFRGDKSAKVMGSLAVDPPLPGRELQGILVKRNFNYHILAPADLNKYTELSQCEVTQRQSIQYAGSPALLRHVLMQLAGTIEFTSETRWRLYGCIDLTIENNIITIEWAAQPVTDMYADAVVAGVMSAALLPNPKHLPLAPKLDRMHFKECVIEMLQDMFGEEAVPKMFKGEKLHVVVDGKRTDIDLLNLEVKCEEDEALERTVHSAISRLYSALAPVRPPLLPLQPLAT
ncbi:Cleavage and polyadenylation specificity factor 73 [Eumeta japonica]|uniref:Cleavage and polyadenylation specificity factor 73 n=1 Tax=Eumeta variegata TaxID=151549 RepID=A0A4C1UH75_EUMVA|nr:Cleavage and polyadenylation specificity factor 73 [Eumeta japonica]